MSDAAKISERLNDVINYAISEGVATSGAGADLIAVASEAVGVLRTIEDFNLKQMTDDMVRLAAQAGTYPPRMLEEIPK